MVFMSCTYAHSPAKVYQDVKTFSYDEERERERERKQLKIQSFQYCFLHVRHDLMDERENRSMNNKLFSFDTRLPNLILRL